MFRLSSQRLLSLSLLALSAPLVAFAGSIEVNGTCETGASPCSPGSVTYPSNTGQKNFNFDYTINGDEYAFSGKYSAVFASNGTHLNVNFTATYIGSSATTTNDVLTLDLFQNFYYPTATSWNGNYTETVPVTLGPTVNNGTSISADAYYDQTHDIGVVGPFSGRGFHYGQKTKNLTGLTGNTLDEDFRFTLDFASGTAPQTYITVNPVPEPSQAIPTVIGLFAIASLVLCRRNFAGTRSK